MQENSNYIVKENPAYTRVLATRHLSGIYHKFCLGFILFYILEEWVPNLLGLVFPSSYFALFSIPSASSVMTQVPDVPFVYVIYMVLLGGALSLGRTLYVMTVLRNREVGYTILMEGMPFYFRATQIYILQMSMFIVGLSAFVVPGIYLFYIYSQALYVFADDPNLSVFQCLRRSREMMTGNIFNMVKLDLMYVTLLAFGYLPVAVVSYIYGFDTKTLSGVMVFLLCRMTFYVALGNLYMGRVTFYELMKYRGFKNFIYAGEKDFREASKPQS